MSIEKARNKQIKGKEKKVKNKYFFPGGGERKPVNIEAYSEKEAQDIYNK